MIQEKTGREQARAEWKREKRRIQEREREASKASRERGRIRHAQH